MRATLAVLLLILAAPAAAEVPEYRSSSELPTGLEPYLEARAAEIHGDVRQALKLYEKAVEAAPEVTEVRVAYASLLQAVGMVEEAANLLRGHAGLDWYGTRVLGLALVQLSLRDPELLSEAQAALEAALAQRPDDISAQMALVQTLERRGEFARAEEIVARLRRLRPGSDQLELVHGSLLQRLGRHRDAVEALEGCVAAEPFAGACSERAIESLIALGRFADAGQRLLESAGADDGEAMLRAAALLLEGGEPGRALELVRTVLAGDPRARGARRLEAIVLSSLGRFEEAAVRLRKLQREDAADVQVALSLAWAESQLDRDAAAREVLESLWRRVGDDPASEDALRTAATAARLELMTGHPVAAREWLLRADPAAAGPDLVRLLAETFRREEQWREGVAALLRIQPRLTGAARDQALAAEAEFRLRQGEEAQAGAVLDRLLGAADPATVGAGLEVLQRLERWQRVAEAAAAGRERFPEARAFTFAEAAARERLGEADRAEALFRSLLAAEPNDAAAANYLGYMWADAGVNLEEALELIRRAVALEPANDAYLDSLGWVHFRLGNLDEAESWLRRAVQLGGNDGTVLAHLGEVLAALDRHGEARDLLQRALELGVEEPARVRELLEELPGGR